jgi:hypothetical protein
VRPRSIAASLTLKVRTRTAQRLIVYPNDRRPPDEPVAQCVPTACHPARTTLCASEASRAESIGTRESLFSNQVQTLDLFLRLVTE